MPLWLRLLAVIVVAYLFSPLDLIPDFIPVLGLLDDIVLVPLGIWIILRYTPSSVRSRAQRKVEVENVQVSAVPATIAVVIIWIACSMWLLFYASQWINGSGM